MAKRKNAATHEASVRQRAAPSDRALFWAKRSIGYGGEDVDRGQVLRLRQLLNDKLLVDLGYIEEVSTEVTRYPCRGCGAEFVDMGMRDQHGRFRHSDRTFAPPPAPERESDESTASYQARLDAWALDVGRMSDAADEQLGRYEDQVAPLDLTKTAATREA